MSDSPFILLDVGGKTFRTYRSTLQTYPGSFLSDLIAKSNEALLKYTEDGHIFLDRNPIIFASVLHFYRTRTWYWPPNVPHDVVLKELEFLNIRTEIEESDGYTLPKPLLVNVGEMGYTAVEVAQGLVGIVPRYLRGMIEDEENVYISAVGLVGLRDLESRFLIKLSEALCRFGDSFIRVFQKEWLNYCPYHNGSLGRVPVKCRGGYQVVVGDGWGGNSLSDHMQIKLAWRTLPSGPVVREGWVVTFRRL